MKKIALLMMAWIGALTMQADKTYPYLTFETTDGAKISVNTESLELTISGTTLTAGDQQFTLTNLNKMYFSTSDESTTGIEEVTNAALDDATEIYDLQGNRVTRAEMRKGVYIIKTKNRTYKVNIR